MNPNYNPIAEEIINNQDDKIGDLELKIANLEDEIVALKNMNASLNDQNVRLARKLSGGEIVRVVTTGVKI